MSTNLGELQGDWDKDMALLPIGSEIDLSFEFLNEDDYIDVTGEVVHHGADEDGNHV